MILSALYEYYRRMAADPESGMPEPGYSEERISFELEISRQGELKRVWDIRDDSGRKPQPKRLQVPKAVIRSSGVASNFLWDNTGYVLGVDGKGKPERTKKTFEAFLEKHRAVLAEHENEPLQAICAFLEQWTPDQFESLNYHEEMLDQNIVFRLEGDDSCIHDHPDVRAVWQSLRQTEDGDNQGICLVTGTEGPISKLHPSIKGVIGAQSAGASIVSFNLESFKSYGKEQNLNAPVSEYAAFAYTTALNYLLRSDKHRLRIGDTTAVFWAGKSEKAKETEDLFEAIMGQGLQSDEPEPGEDTKTVTNVHRLLTALRDGIPVDRDLADKELLSTPFYILGLAPNQSRLSVRFWHVSTFGDLAKNVARHYADLALERQFPNQPEFPANWQILRETAALGKSENIPPLLNGALLRSVLGGTRYPETLFTALLSRIRTDKTLNYVRTAALKACLLRNHTDNSGEITMSLNPDRKDTPYLLGRLFSLLEKVQKDALGKNINATIRDRYFGAASATPAVTFPQLLRLAQHHIKKAEYGHLTDREIQAVLNDIEDFPPRLSLQEQGVFTIGYYHQSNANYIKKTDNAAEKE